MSDSPVVKRSIVLDAEHFDLTMGMVLERLETIQVNQADAFAAGFRSVINDEKTWETVVTKITEVTKKRADEAAAKGFWWLLRNFILTAVLVTAIFFTVAKIFGWEVATKAAKGVANLLGV